MIGFTAESQQSRSRVAAESQQRHSRVTAESQQRCSRVTAEFDSVRSCRLTDSFEVIGHLNVLSSNFHKGDVDFIQNLRTDTSFRGLSSPVTQVPQQTDRTID